MRLLVALAVTLGLAGCHLIFPFSVVQPPGDAGETGDGKGGPDVTQLMDAGAAEQSIKLDHALPDTAPPGDGATGPACSGAASCPKGYVCDIHGCTDGATGACVLKQSTCPSTIAWVCGCDGVSYKNTCNRLKFGAALDHTGPC